MAFFEFELVILHFELDFAIIEQRRIINFRNRIICNNDRIFIFQRLIIILGFGIDL
jgi:hypothetical protein